MGIDYDAGTETITVTGGSFEEPCTMAILDVDGTVGGYITPGGYGNREYTVSKNLVIGSNEGSTFFDLGQSLIVAAEGYSITCYSHALRGGTTQETWAARVFGPCLPITGQDKEFRICNVTELYFAHEFILDGCTGYWRPRDLQRRCLDAVSFKAPSSGFGELAPDMVGLSLVPLDASGDSQGQIGILHPSRVVVARRR